MFIPAQIVALLLAEHARDPYAGPVLAYGNQPLNVTRDDALWMFETLGLRPDAAASVGDAALDLAALIDLMGLGALQTLDAAPGEGIDVVADLDRPVPDALLERFGLILDFGVLEHVFDLRAGMKNTAGMLRPGGSAVHVPRVNNYLNYGFVQRSPTLFYDYYTENGFENVRGTIIVQPRSGGYEQRWNLLHYDHAIMGGVNSMFNPAQTQLAGYFTARKTAGSTADRVPLQSYFARLGAGRDPLPYQFVVAHDALQADVRLVDDPKPGPGRINLFTPIYQLGFAPAQAS